MTKFAEDICTITENFNMGFIDCAELISEKEDVFINANLPYNREEMKKYRDEISEIASKYVNKIFGFDDSISQI